MVGRCWKIPTQKPAASSHWDIWDETHKTSVVPAADATLVATNMGPKNDHWNQILCFNWSMRPFWGGLSVVSYFTRQILLRNAAGCVVQLKARYEIQKP
jgi:hypothetical protein